MVAVPCDVAMMVASHSSSCKSGPRFRLTIFHLPACKASSQIDEQAGQFRMHRCCCTLFALSNDAEGFFEGPTLFYTNARPFLAGGPAIGKQVLSSSASARCKAMVTTDFSALSGRMAKRGFVSLVFRGAKSQNGFRHQTGRSGSRNLISLISLRFQGSNKV